jgi:NAD(P)-dependent dehydrogenase (short-subunit alcohol dehydrogenase family)
MTYVEQPVARAPAASGRPRRPTEAATAHRTVVITGATSGMGRVAAKNLARRGARLFLVGRSRDRLEATKSECLAELGSRDIDYVVADLSSIHQVRRAAAEIRRRLDRVDTLMNNAGGTFPTRRIETDEGFELSFVLQYLSRHVLTEELIDLIRASDDPIVMTTSAGGTYLDRDIDLDDLQSQRSYGRFRLMSKAGTLNDLHTHEQAKRHEGIAFINFAPGLVRTNTTMRTIMSRIFFQTIGRIFSRSPDDAGAEMAELAAGGYEGGYYGPGLERNVPAWTPGDSERASQLWHRTERLLGELDRR